jgi:hypothetical protein
MLGTAAGRLVLPSYFVAVTSSSNGAIVAHDSGVSM